MTRIGLYVMYAYMIEQRRKALGRAPGSGHKLVKNAPSPEKLDQKAKSKSKSE